MQLRIASTFLLCVPALAAAQTTTDSASTHVDIPVLDVPYNTAHGLRAPSMAQAQALGATFYEATHEGIQRAWGNHKWFARFSIIGADIADTLVLPLPGSDGWAHEEFHRTVLGQRRAGSFNDVYKVRIAADAIAVSHVEDADLVALKRDHPGEQVRLSAAGLEGEYQLVQGLEKREFFDRRRSFQMPLYWIQKLTSIGYVMSGTWDETN